MSIFAIVEMTTTRIAEKRQKVVLESLREMVARLRVGPSDGQVVY